MFVEEVKKEAPKRKIEEVATAVEEAPRPVKKVAEDVKASPAPVKAKTPEKTQPMDVDTEEKPKEKSSKGYIRSFSPLDLIFQLCLRQVLGEEVHEDWTKSTRLKGDSRRRRELSSCKILFLCESRDSYARA